MPAMTKKVPLFVGTISLVLTSAQAQSPQKTTTTYDDWTVSCAAGAAGDKSCELVQSQYIQGQTSPVSQITISRPAKGGPLRLFLQVPPNVWLETGVRLRADDKDSGIAGTFRWCAPSRCLADTELSEATVAKLRAASTPGILSWKNPSQQDMKITFPVKGFSQALNAMSEGQTANPVASRNPTPPSAQESARRFDGAWSIEADCQAIPPNVAKAVWITNGKIENGKLSAKYSVEGQPGTSQYEGVVAANGNIEVVVTGLTGASKFTNVPANTPYSWKAIGSLSESRGRATKTGEGRTCILSFAKGMK